MATITLQNVGGTTASIDIYEECDSIFSFTPEEVVVLVVSFMFGQFVFRRYVWTLERPRRFVETLVHTLLHLVKLASDEFALPQLCQNQGKQKPSMSNSSERSERDSSQRSVEKGSDIIQKLAEAHRQADGQKQAGSDRPDCNAVDSWLAAADAASFNCQGFRACSKDSQSHLPEPELFSRAIEAAVENRDFERASILASRAGWQAPTTASGQAAFLTFACWLSRNQRGGQASWCVDAVISKGGNVDLTTLRTFLTGSARAGNMQRAETYYRQMESANLNPDFTTFSALVRGFCNAGEVDRAVFYMQMMIDREIRLDAPLCDLLLECCARRTSLEHAEKVLSAMEDLNLCPSNYTLAMLITIFSARGELQRAIAMFENSPQRYRLEPDAHAYGALIFACANHGRADLSLQAHERMTKTGCQPRVQTYELLIRCCIRLGQLNKAVELVDEALCLQEPRQSEDASASVHPSFVDPKIVEDVLSLIGRRRKANSLGLPLLERLRCSGFEIRENLAESLECAAAAEASEGPSILSRDQRLEQRHGELKKWRNFPSAKA
eukprot:TRINITY_DN4306_c0_g1_i1.p1 TRINITY_DN4306_c0_g1~~TRINITY_DN4306_c0_g1_i1.p1  ORF type:complete len:554 (+),score=108.46 TRINITY_DN4306_c0_g1_i1:162-1823(+)